MRRIILGLVISALAVPASAATALAGPCGPEDPVCQPCPLVITIENKKPKIESAQC